MLKWFMIGFLVLVVGTALGVTYLYDDDGQAVAEVACEDMVNDKLKAPSSAEFDHSSEDQNGDTWTIEGTVESDNAGGHPVASDYLCVVTINGDKWTGRAEVQAR